MKTAGKTGIWLPVVLLPVLLVLGICAGAFWISPAALLHFGEADPAADPVADLRLIRMLAALTVGGSLLVEKFFAVPGMGPELTTSISRYDLNLVQGIVLLYATMGILGVFLGDLLMTLIDPRIKLTGKGDVR